jgi:uncharacterized membrane protein YdjX (TVP38/TMEM64 family)
MKEADRFSLNREKYKGYVMNVRKLFLFFAAAVLIIILGFFVSVQYKELCDKCLSLEVFTPESIRNYINGFGSWAVVVYIFLYALNTITLLPPIAIMSLSAGFLFGPVKGLIALTLGAFLGTSATFFISRYLGGRFVDKIVKGKARDFQQQLSRNGFFVIFPIRLIGFPPWELVNYVSGLSKIKYRDYISATMIGILPAIVIQVFFSDRISNFNPKDPVLYIAVGAFIVLAVVPAMILKARKKKAMGADDE